MTPPTPMGGFTPAVPVISKMLPPTDKAEVEGQLDMSIMSGATATEEGGEEGGWGGGGVRKWRRWGGRNSAIIARTT